MKLIKIDLSGVAKGAYGFSSLRFTICLPPVNRFVKRVFNFQGCREEIIKKVRNDLAAKSPKIDQKKTRLLLYNRISIQNQGLSLKQIEECCATPRKNLHAQIGIGHKLINHYEKRHNWPLTKLYKVDVRNDAQLVAYMVVGSGRWQKTSHYLSLYMLMLRLGRSGFKNSKWEHGTIIRNLKSFALSGVGDAQYVVITLPKWDILFEEQKTLVGKNTMKQMYSNKRLAHGTNGYSEGISMLCNGNSYDLLLSYRFQDVCRKRGIHQRVHCKPDAKITGG